MLAEKQRDQALRRRPASGHSTAAPRDRAGQAQHVEHHAGSYRSDARREHVALPRARGRFDAIELRDHLAQAVEAQQPDSGATCCQTRRKRMKSAGLTGAISARRRFSV